MQKTIIPSKLSLNILGLFLVAFFLIAFAPKSFAQTSQEGKLILRIDDRTESLPYSEYSKWFTFSPSLSYDSSYRSEIENTEFCIEKNLPCSLLLTERARFHTKKNVSLSFEKEAALGFLTDLAKDIDRDPVNAKFKMEDGKVSAFSLDKKGISLDTEQSLVILASLFTSSSQLQNQNEVSLPFKTILSEIKADDVNNLGINTLIGEGKSDFRGSTKSRIHNIRVATARYDGIILAPGQEFSFVDILGPVDGEHGYLPELVIKKDKTEPEFGGGICQVSTTVFRAAIYTGLEITARKNHSYPVSYYNPQGMDATVYIPRPDLKFKNNTPGHILIQTKIEGTELTFSFYGTGDGRKVEVDGPHILEKNADGSMRTIFTQKVTSKDGREIINESFNSFYDSPSKYPHPSQEKITKKPKDWSKSQWDLYKKVNGL